MFKFTFLASSVLGSDLPIGIGENEEPGLDGTGRVNHELCKGEESIQAGYISQK